MKQLTLKGQAFIKSIFSEADGTGSSKRVAALWVILILVTAIVAVELYIPVAAAKHKIEIKASVINQLQFLGSVVLPALLSFAGLIFGFNIAQNIQAMKKDQNTPDPQPENQPQSI